MAGEVFIKILESGGRDMAGPSGTWPWPRGRPAPLPNLAGRARPPKLPRRGRYFCRSPALSLTHWAAKGSHWATRLSASRPFWGSSTSLVARDRPWTPFGKT